MIDNTSLSPQWDIESEYPSLMSVEFQTDLKWCEDKIQQLKKLNVDNQVDFFLNAFEVKKTLSALITYTHACQNINTSNNLARQMENNLQNIFAQLDSLLVPIESWFKSLSEEDFKKQFIENEKLLPFKFKISEHRKLADFHLSDAEEKLLCIMEIPGHNAWSSLYDQISGTARIETSIENETKQYSLSELGSFLFSDNSLTRETAWKSIQMIWQTHENSAAAIINGLADWRLSVNKLRSQKSQQSLDHLSYPLHANRINRTVLDTLLEACKDALPQTQVAYKKMAKTIGKEKLAPWDLNAGIPKGTQQIISYKNALELIGEALGKVAPEFAAFVKMMDEKKWIEGRVLPEKNQGGYCTDFIKSRTPRIFMTYRGSLTDVMILAHELGHAYHSWIMRDMHLAQISCPMNLAETASIFFETAVRDQLLENTTSQNEKNQILWNELESAGAFLINIPARFEFEHQMNLKKREVGLLSAKDLCLINKAAWEKWYGDTLTTMDERYWASKMHFSMTHLFYNFPYTFGYLFSLAIYSRKDVWGKDFLNRYKSLLRDTGQMTAEELSLKYLDQSLADKSFWLNAINQIMSKVAKFEA